MTFGVVMARFSWQWFDGARLVRVDKIPAGISGERCGCRYCRNKSRRSWNCGRGCRERRSCRYGIGNSNRRSDWRMVKDVVRTIHVKSYLEQ